MQLKIYCKIFPGYFKLSNSHIFLLALIETGIVLFIRNLLLKESV